MERRCRFVQGEVVRLPLPGDEWIDVKRELNAGEARGVFSSLVKKMDVGAAAELDPERVGLTKVVAYVVGWSLLNTQGRPEPVSESAFNGLDQQTYIDIVTAVDLHDAACGAIRQARKNGQGGEKPLPAISPSLDGMAGVSSGSVS